MYTGIHDKAKCLQAILKELDIDGAEAIYIGDDLIDLPAFEVAGFSLAPADALAEVREAADAVTPQKGGFWAVRHVCDWIRSLPGNPA